MIDNLSGDATGDDIFTCILSADATKEDVVASWAADIQAFQQAIVEKGLS